MKTILTRLAILAALAVFGASIFATENIPAPQTASVGNDSLLEYKFEEDVVDSSGNQRNGNVQGNPTSAEGWVDKCIVLDGEGDYIDCGPAPAELGQTFTVECWVKPDVRQNLHADIFGNHAHGGLGFVMQQDGTNLNRFAVSFGAGAGQWITTRPVQLAGGTWQHVAMVKTPETLTFLFNGVPVASAQVTALMAASPTTLRVGLGFDELGVMVHQEHYGSWQMEDSPQLFQRWDRCLAESIVRDRNHASVVAWGLLNETGGDRPAAAAGGQRRSTLH